MAPKSRIGSVTAGLTDPLTKTARDTYRNLAEHYPSPDLVLRMLDADLPLRRVRTAQAVYYMSPARIETWRKENNKVFTVDPEVPSGLAIGNTSFDAARAREFGLATAFCDSKAAVAEALRLSSQSLSEDWLVGKQPVVWRIDVTGTLNKASIDSLRRRINSAVGRGAELPDPQPRHGGGRDRLCAGACRRAAPASRVKNGSISLRKLPMCPRAGRSAPLSTSLSPATKLSWAAARHWPTSTTWPAKKPTHWRFAAKRCSRCSRRRTIRCCCSTRP